MRRPWYIAGEPTALVVSTSPRLYLDWNATTPPADEVVAAMAAAIATSWGNPSSVHGDGRRARALVEDAREEVALLLERDARDVVFTSGGTEANNLALELVATAGGSLVVGRIEHPSVVRPAERLAERGIDVVWVEPDASGLLPPAAFEQAIATARSPVRLVSLQAVNHETGVIQPVDAVAEIARRTGAWLHCDAVQAAGKLGPDAWRGADLVSIAAHKIRGPKGIGALVSRPGLRIGPVLRGGSQERGLRPGTLDPVAAAGFGAAAARARTAPPRWRAVAPVRDALEAVILGLCPAAVIHGRAAGRVAHVVNASLRGWSGPEIVAALDLEGIAVSSGSACSAGTAEPSPVIAALAGAGDAASAVRFSLGEDADLAVIARVEGALRRVLGRPSRDP